MGKILVSGATGNTGSAVVNGLKTRGLDFAAMVRDPAKKEGLENDGIEAVLADFTDKATVKAALKGIDKAFLVCPPHPDMMQMEFNFIDEAIAAGLSHLVYISVIDVSETSPPHLGKWHVAVEEKLKNSKISYTILKPHSFMQNLLMNIPTVKAQGAIYTPMGDGKIPFVDARDIGEVAAQILASPADYAGQTFNITGPTTHSFHDVANMLSDLVGKEVKYIAVPGDAAKQGMMGAGLPEWLADDLVDLNRKWSQGEASPDPSAENILGKQGRTLLDFLQEHAFLFTD